MLLSSTSFELDDLDQGDHDSLDSWVHHLLIAVDHVSMPLFSAFSFFTCLFLMFVANREPFLFPLLQTEKPEMRSKLNSSPYYSYSAPSCSETVACDILLSRLFKCFRGIFCSTDRGTNKRMLCYAHSTHIQIRLDHDEILFSVFEPLFTTRLTRFPSSRDAGCPSQRSPIYAAGGSSAGALYTQNRLPPLNFVSGGPLP